MKITSKTTAASSLIPALLFFFTTLLARLEALSHREQRSFQKTSGYQLGDVEINFLRAEVRRKG